MVHSCHALVPESLRIRCAYGTRCAHEGACALRLRYHQQSLTEPYWYLVKVVSSIFAVVFAYLILKEVPSPLFVPSGLLVLSGLVFISKSK